MVKQIFRTNVTVINKSQSNLQTCFRMLFTAITLSFNPFCALHINDEIKTSFTLLSLHCRPIFTIHSAISYSVSCLLPISLQPKYNIKHLVCHGLRLASHMLASICFRVAPINGLNQFLQFFPSNSFNHTGS